MNDFLKYHIGSQIHNVYKSYDLGNSHLSHFTMRSLINPYYHIGNLNYIRKIHIQLSHINKLRYQYKYLDEHSNVIQQIIKKYPIIKRKIYYINDILGLHIHKPFVYDIDQPFKEKSSDRNYSSRIQYLFDQYHEIEVGNEGEKRTFSNNIFEGDHPIMDVNIPDRYGLRGHSIQYMHDHRLNNQMDIVIVNDRGVFILEIKNFKSPTFDIKSSGRIYITISDGQQKPECNVVDQNARHQAAMEEFLRDHNIYHANVHTLIICANEDAKVNSHIPNIHIYKPHTFYPAFINRQEPDLLSPDKVNFIYNLLKYHYSGHDSEESFPEPVFKDHYLNNISYLFNYERAIFSLDKIAYRLMLAHKRYSHHNHYRYSQQYHYHPRRGYYNFGHFHHYNRYYPRGHRYPYNRYGHRKPWY